MKKKEEPAQEGGFKLDMITKKAETKKVQIKIWTVNDCRSSLEALNTHNTVAVGVD